MAVLGVAVLGTAVLGVAVLGTAVLGTAVVGVAVGAGVGLHVIRLIDSSAVLCALSYRRRQPTNHVVALPANCCLLCALPQRIGKSHLGVGKGEFGERV